MGWYAALLMWIEGKSMHIYVYINKPSPPPTLQHRQRLRLQPGRLLPDHAHAGAGLDNPALLPRDLPDRVPQRVGVLQVQPRDPAGQRGRDHVGGVVPAADPHLEDQRVGAFLHGDPEAEEREEAEVAGDGVGPGGALLLVGWRLAGGREVLLFVCVCVRIGVSSMQSTLGVEKVDNAICGPGGCGPRRPRSAWPRARRLGVSRPAGCARWASPGAGRRRAL